MSLRIRLTRLENDRHRFEALRADGGVEVRELETRSFLIHDLIHFAIETEAKLTDSFYGLVGRGGDYDRTGAPMAGEAMQTERVVAALQGALHGEVDPQRFVDRFREVSDQIGSRTPDWLTAELVTRALKRLREVQGRWKATPFGQTMELVFDV
ncbi:MAG TPA: hypothetical protein VG942_12195 [Hyphomonadaceae bacterium]|nr:hypothetical protein [Hyphomonadaceae bacterium]